MAAFTEVDAFNSFSFKQSVFTLKLCFRKNFDVVVECISSNKRLVKTWHELYQAGNKNHRMDNSFNILVFETVSSLLNDGHVFIVYVGLYRNSLLLGIEATIFIYLTKIVRIFAILSFPE